MMVWWNEEGQESRKTTIYTKDRLLICDRWAVLHSVTASYRTASYRTESYRIILYGMGGAKKSYHH